MSTTDQPAQDPIVPPRTTSPRVTVLMTYYNKGTYVLDAVHSILAQTFGDFELLVVDDASTDGGLDPVRAIGDPRIRILESAVNTGRAAAANRGYDAARGEYVAVLDADDLMYPQRLEKQVAFMDAHPEVGALGTYADIIGTGASMSAWKLTDPECRAALLLGDPLWYGAAMFRRSVLEEHGLRCDPDWRTPGMDHLFLLRLAFHTQYANLPETLNGYRLGAQNMRHGRDPVADRAAMYREAFRIFGIPASDAEVGLQLMLHRLFKEEPRVRDVRALREWLDRLIAMNRKHDWFPADGFEALLEARWRNLFFHFADTSWGLGWEHLRSSKSYPKERVYYLLRALFDRRTGKPAPKSV
jgi:glycosyltransferase involved in cell wall biosynthesis